MIYTILLVVFLLLMGAVISATFAERSLRGDRPPIYWNESFMHLINFLWIPMIVVFIILLFSNWLITLAAGLISWLLLGNLLRRISEYLIVIPLAKILLTER
jgi:hypothetical protein